jgi:uncharacterized damage-inducible protein DinB
MSSEYQTLAPLYQGWQNHHQHLITTIGRLSQDQLALRAAPHIRSIGTLGAHILAVRAWWLHFVMNEGGTELEPLRSWDDDDPVRCTATELVSGLEASWNVLLAGLKRWTPDDLYQTFQTHTGPRERQWILAHMRDHEFHHGGEFFLTCNMYRLLASNRSKDTSERHGSV